MICKHSAEVLNAPRAAAFADFERIGFPTRKMEKYKYTDVSKYFEPDFGLNLNRLAIPVNPYEVFKCDVPNMSTALYFVVNDAFYDKALPKSHLPEGVIFGSLKEVADSLKIGKGSSTRRIQHFSAMFADHSFRLREEFYILLFRIHRHSPTSFFIQSYPFSSSSRASSGPAVFTIRPL